MPDTIFALSSGALPAAIAIVRLSGPAAEVTAECIAGSLPEPRRATLRRLHGRDGSLIDRALVLRFVPPHSATGEPLVEFHLHGGRAVVARLLRELADCPGCRAADPGEFTRRALLNGRVDLTEAEGLADLLSAETEWQRRAAIAGADGALRRQVESWRERVVALSARAEAAIDYVDEEEETGTDSAQLFGEAEALAREWRVRLARPRAELLDRGLRIVLSGPPNSGKSSLFNALIGHDKAIVTPIPGTTRDLIEARLDLGGVPILLVDTAGLRDSDDVVERIGVERAQRAGEHADILIWLGDPAERPTHSQIIQLHARADERPCAPEDAISTSVMLAGGTDALVAEIKERAALLLPPPDQVALNQRQADALAQAAEALGLCRASDLLLTAEGLRQALTALDRLTGRQGTEDVLDALFGRFCLGK